MRVGGTTKRRSSHYSFFYEENYLPLSLSRMQSQEPGAEKVTRKSGAEKVAVQDVFKNTLPSPRGPITTKYKKYTTTQRFIGPVSLLPFIASVHIMNPKQHAVNIFR